MSNFECFMVHHKIGGNRKVRRLPVAQRWAYVAGVLALASQSPMRGALLITDGEPVTAEDVRDEANVTLSEARACLATLRRLGMLQTDPAGVEWVHDWDALNKDPRPPKPSDSPEARRERKRAQRTRDSSAGHTVVTRDITRVTPPQVKVEGEEQRISSPDVGSEASTSAGTPSLAEKVVGVLQRGLDGLTSDEPCKKPSAVRVAGLLAELAAPELTALAVATEVRSITQSQNRAPNIEALYAQKLRAAIAATARGGEAA